MRGLAGLGVGYSAGVRPSREGEGLGAVRGRGAGGLRGGDRQNVLRMRCSTE